MEFSEWITSKYVEWRGNAVGREKTVTEYAAWIGVKQQVMSGWMKPGGNIPKSAASIQALIARYDGEVYDILGIQPQDTEPDPWLVEQRDHFAEMFPDSQVIIVRDGDDLSEVLEPGQEYVFVQRASKAGAGVVLEIKRQKKE